MIMSENNGWIARVENEIGEIGENERV